MFNGDMGQRILFFKNASGYKCENVSQLSQDSWVVSKVSGMARSRVSKDTERTSYLTCLHLTGFFNELV